MLLLFGCPIGSGAPKDTDDSGSADTDSGQSPTEADGDDAPDPHPNEQLAAAGLFDVWPKV